MKKSFNTTESDLPNQATELEEPPVLVPPKDPLESSGFERNKTKSISIDTRTKEAMLITSNQVELIATPQIAYKITRVVNHFIKHIIQHHSDDASSVNTESIWYKNGNQCILS